MQGSLPGGCDAVDKIPVARIVEALENPGGAYQHNGMDRHFPDIRFIWWAGGANFTHHQDTNRLIRAWQKPELVVISNASGRLRRNTRISFCLRPLRLSVLISP